MTEGVRYVVLGCGRQGQAAVLDLIRFGDAREIVLADASLERAEGVRSWLESRTDRAAKPLLTVASCDAEDPAQLRRILAEGGVVVAAMPYRFILPVTDAAIESGAHVCDLGGHPETVQQQLEWNERARARGVAVVPDCGQAPGMSTTLTMLALQMVKRPDTLELWDGGLPVAPTPPLFYRLTFDIRGLTNEYDGPCWAIREGRAVAFEALGQRQEVDFPPPLGRLEAFVASGTGSTLPWTLEGEIAEFTSRVVRHPGHLDRMRTLKELGFLGHDPVAVNGTALVPRRFTEALLEPLLVGEGPIEDVVVVRAHCRGHGRDGPVQGVVELMAFSDPETGLTAMQRCTGFDIAIVAAMAARGEIKPGVSVRERSVDPERYVEELARRGIEVRHEVRPDEA